MNSSKGKPDRISRSLWAIVAVIGPAAFAVDLGSPALVGYPVRLSVLAAVVAAVGLLPGQATHGWIVVALAVTGCLDALAVWVKAGETGWGAVVILALNSVQSAAALGALLRENGASGSAEYQGVSDYSAYVRLVEAYQAYATQYQLLFSPAQKAAGQASAQAQSEATAPAPADAAADAFAALQARYIRHGAGGAAQQSRGWTEPSAAALMADSGVPDANRMAPESPPHQRRQQDSGAASLEQTGL